MPAPTKPQLIIHFMRHAEAEHKVYGDNSIRDPELTEKGEKQCHFFERNLMFKEAIKITHILCSPMTRTIQTAELVSLALPNTITVTALPELQNLDSGPNGQGLDLEELVEQYGPYEDGFMVEGDIDVSTFGREGWNEKKEGIWSSKEVQWRVDHVKGFLKGMWAASDDKRMEVVVVSHGSFLKKLVNNAIFIPSDAQLTSCVFDDDGGFREIGAKELKQLRKLAKNYYVV
ncbi:hypothetical protein VTL71DRAFT_12354 [Oculimacula yallundae]|uniref:Phosphoglycerate mutase n=1 Tax=Oculimacula yallundae TaxID=86028 RepID=A0ABR4CPZ5_9HELO